jgi:flagellar motor switch protein FliG
MMDFTPLPALTMGGAGGLDNGPASDDPPPKARMALGKRAKAAVIVRLWLNEGADIPLEDLPTICRLP